MTDLTPGERRRGLIAAISLVTISGIGLSMLYPLLALALDKMGAPGSTVGLFSTVGSVATLGITPFIPRLLRVVGTLPLIMGSTFVAIACTLAFKGWPEI